MKSKRVVLIIEDDHDIRVTLRTYLEAMGYFVVSAAHGANALEALSNMSPPDVILLDMIMPIMNGDQFLEIKKTNPRFAPIPVIQMSAASSHQRPGTCSLITKPLDMPELIQCIESC